MIIWVVVIVLLASASFLQDLLFHIEMLSKPDNLFWAILLDILLFLVALGMLYRMSVRRKTGEREELVQRVEELEARLKEKEG